MVPASIGSPLLQVPLDEHLDERKSASLHGRFLHITDLHPDVHYRIHASTDEESACHRGTGVSGFYGAETTDCDTPFTLLDATFKWIEENVKGTIDFVVWTGDSARHDSDEQIPRTEKEVLKTNIRVADKFKQVFGNSEDPRGGLEIPIISTFGNNDILPHNILLAGPNKWLKTYTSIWSHFIPEEQRHGFERGGWYYVEVVPKKLAVFSLNTLYFFNNNAAVDGCDMRSEPGFDHFEWLRIQLQFMRERGMKVILIGHVPPARTDSKQLWDETCWQKYTLWLQQYRDIIVGGLYGHMNIDHFMLQDTRQISILGSEDSTSQVIRTSMDDEFTIQGANDYLEDLRKNWAKLPNPAPVMKTAFEEASTSKKKKKKPKPSPDDKLLKRIGGKWGERFQLTLSSPSLVPNYFPTLRIVEYNISGLDASATWASVQGKTHAHDSHQETEDDVLEMFDAISQEESRAEGDDASTSGKKHKKKKPKKPSNPNLIVPQPPSKATPPGPAYSPQTLTLLGYTQYFANLTHINNDIPPDEPGEDAETDKWREGKHKGKKPKNKKPHPKPFKYKVEYSTFNDTIYQLEDLTVRSYIKLAHRIGQYKPGKGSVMEESDDTSADDIDEVDELDDDELDSGDEIGDGDDDEVKGQGEKDKKKKTKEKKKKHDRQKKRNKVWLRFVKRAFVGTLDEEELRKLEDVPVLEGSASHDEEL